MDRYPFSCSPVSTLLSSWGDTVFWEEGYSVDQWRFKFCRSLSHVLFVQLLNRTTHPLNFPWHFSFLLVWLLQYPSEAGIRSCGDTDTFLDDSHFVSTLPQLWTLSTVSYTEHYISAWKSTEMCLCKYWGVVAWLGPYPASWSFLVLTCNCLPHVVIVTIKGNIKKILKHYACLYSKIIESEK